MNYEALIEELKKWDEDEKFYREVWQRRKKGEPLDPLYEREDIDPEVREWALDPDTMDPYKTEETFFANGRNVTLVKHPRYLPFFTHQHAFFEIRYSTFMDIFYNIIRDKSQIAVFFLGNLFEKDKTRYLLYHTSEDEVIRNYILDMYMEQMHMDDYSDRIICSLLTIFFTQLTRRHGMTVEIPEKAGRKTEYDDEILNYIIQNYNTVTLGDVASRFHFSEPYCSKLIAGITGITFSELLTRIRLQNGENMLAHTQMSIADISEKIGYKNPETFVRSFSRNYHMTPSQYRKSLG